MVTITELDPAAQAVHTVAVVVISNVIVEAEAVAGIT